MDKILNIPKNIVGFFTGTVSELKLVDYISRRQTLGYTLFVLIFLVFGTLLIIGIDAIVLQIRELLFSI
jgi:preprotein translocase SecE subunit